MEPITACLWLRGIAALKQVFIDGTGSTSPMPGFSRYQMALFFVISILEGVTVPCYAPRAGKGGD